MPLNRRLAFSVIFQFFNWSHAFFFTMWHVDVPLFHNSKGTENDGFFNFGAIQKMPSQTRIFRVYAMSENPNLWRVSLILLEKAISHWSHSRLIWQFHAREDSRSRSVRSLLLSINFTPDQSMLFWSEQFYSRSVEAFLIGAFFRAVPSCSPIIGEDPWFERSLHCMMMPDVIQQFRLTVHSVITKVAFEWSLHMVIWLMVL